VPKGMLSGCVYWGVLSRGFNCIQFILLEQMNSCSRPTLILACVIYWLAKETSRVVRRREPQDGDIDAVMLEHVSAIFYVSTPYIMGNTYWSAIRSADPGP
jgi:hypothetical protein